MDPQEDPIVRDLRERISELDLRVLELVNERLRVVADLWRLKTERGYDRADPGREQRLLAARYTIGRTSFVCPAELGGRLAARAQELALDVFRLLGCRGFARVDLMLEEGSDELYVLESNVIPGLTETSLLPQAAEAAGISFDELVGRVLEGALSSRPRSPRA